MAGPELEFLLCDPYQRLGEAAGGAMGEAAKGQLRIVPGYRAPSAVAGCGKL